MVIETESKVICQTRPHLRKGTRLIAMESVKEAS